MVVCTEIIDYDSDFRQNLAGASLHLTIEDNYNNSINLKVKKSYKNKKIIICFQLKH